MVFISYRRESPEHSARVLAFAMELREAGVPVELDELFLKQNSGGPDVGWPKWCEDQVSKASKILIIASDGWFERFENGAPPSGADWGAAYEAQLIRTQISGTGGQTSQHRLVRLETSAPPLPYPLPLRPIHCFDGEKPTEVDSLCSWLGHPRRQTADTATALAWPAVPADDKWPFADATDVRDAFAELLRPDATHRVLLVRGGTEAGKTSITKYLLGRGLKLGFPSGRLDLKGGTGLDQELKRFAVHLVAEGKSVDEILGEGGTVDRLQRLVSHLRQQAKPALLIIDTYDEAQDREYSAWIESLILATLRFESLRVIVSGQKVHSNWTSLAHGLAQYLQLRPPDINDWLECARVHRPRFSKEFVEILFEQAEGSAATIAGIFKLDIPRA